ncbi:hypothetical protein EIP86_009309 [Pleurotus ostreatoroseus]|nr:hypothetical protein EIP86_009309 [Pleurotus ostreatoroseus]
MRADSMVSNMDDAAEVAQDAATPASREAFLQALEKQDSELSALLTQYSYKIMEILYAKRDVRIQYNAVAPNISRLPPELLSLIFQAFVDDYWAAASKHSYQVDGIQAPIYRTPMCGWLVILHICHYWRSIALGTPSLWNRIELGCEPYVELSLRNSGDLPLEIFAGRSASPRHLPADLYSSRTIVHTLFPVFSRLRTAIFRVTNPNIRHAFELLYDRGSELQAPVMETLVIIIDNDKTIDSITILSALDLPRLTSLAIDNCPFALLESFIRPTLTTLKVALSPVCPAGALVHVLEQLPLLGRLQLSGFQQGVVPVPATNYRPSWCRTIRLPHLKDVYLETRSRGHDIAHLLCCLDFPADTKITLSIGPHQDFYPVTNDNDFKDILPLVMSKALVSHILTRTKPTRMAIPRVIEVQPWDISSMQVSLWSTLRPSDIDSSVTRATALQRLYFTMVAPRAEALVSLFELLDLTEVVTLDIHDEIGADNWMRIFRGRTLLKLRDLILNDNQPIEELLSLISTPMKSSSRAEPTTSTDNDGKKDHIYLFPTLKNLTLNYCVFRNQPQKALRYDRLPVIIRALRIRAKHGYKVEKLIIRHPINLTIDRDIAALRDPRIADDVEIEQGVEEAWPWPEEDSEEEDERELELALEALET